MEDHSEQYWSRAEEMKMVFYHVVVVVVVRRHSSASFDVWQTSSSSLMVMV